MEKGLVTLIMPVYNGVQHTRNMINSLKGCTEQTYELIIVNNGSTDDTKEYLTQEPCQLINNSKNLGWSQAINQAIKFAKGEFIGIIHNDIDFVFSPDWLKKMLAHFEDPTIGVVGPTTNNPPDKLDRQSDAINESYSIERANHLASFCMLFRREVFNEVGEFDEQFFPHGGEEIDYAIRINKTKWKMVISRDVFVHHEGGATLHNMSEWKENPEAYQQKIRQLLINKWGEEKVDSIYRVPPKVLIVVPHTGFIPPRHYTSMIRMQAPSATEFLDISRAPVQTARNLGIQFAQSINAEYLFFIDSDAIVTQDLLLRLLKHEKDIVGIIAYTRNKPFFPCVFRRRQEDGHDDWASVDSRGHGLLEVAGVGAHALLIHSRVFNTLKSPWFEFGKFGEDLMFCEKARKAGFKIYCDTSITLPHIGENIVVDEKIFLVEKAHREAEEKNKDVKHDAPQYTEIVSPDPRKTVKIPII